MSEYQHVISMPLEVTTRKAQHIKCFMAAPYKWRSYILPVVHDISSGSLHVLLTLFICKGCYRMIGTSISIPDPIPVQWPVSGYKQLIPEYRQMFSSILEEQIEGYFL